MGKIVETRELYKNTINRITTTKEEWIKFLNSSSWHFKYNFVDKVLIYAQRPEATACAEMQDWNKKTKRWINSNANAIFVLSKNDDSPYPFRLVFDVSDTHNSRNTDYKLWSVKPEYEEKIIETLENEFGWKGKENDLHYSIINNAEIMVKDNIQDYLTLIYENKKGTIFEDLSEGEIYNIVYPIVWSSVSYMMLRRCGINATEYINIENFAYINYFNDSKLITTFGTMVSDIAEMGIREIQKTVINLQIEEKNQNRTFAENQKIEHSNNRQIIEGGKENEENRIRENGRLQHTKHNNGEGENTNRQICENATKLSKGIQEGQVFDTINEQGIEQRIVRDSRESYRNGKQDSETISETRGNNRGIESTRPNEMGRTNEQLQDYSRRTSNEGIDLQLEQNQADNLFKQYENIKNDLLTESEQKQNIAEANASVFSFSQEMIDNALKIGSGKEKGKFRICEYLTKNLSIEENTEFLKQEYGVGSTSENEDGISKWYNSSGITLIKEKGDNHPTLKLTWKQAEKRIRELISLNRYLTKLQKEEYYKWLEEKETQPVNNEIQKTIKEEDNKIPYYEFNIGDIVFIGTEEYQVQVINDERVTLIDTSFPLFVKEMQRELFDRRVQDNPENAKLRTRIDNKAKEKINSNNQVSDNIEINIIQKDKQQAKNKEIDQKEAQKMKP